MRSGKHKKYWTNFFSPSCYHQGLYKEKWHCKACSVQFSCSVVFDSLWPHGLQHARLPCPSLYPKACSNSCPLSWWCHPTISSSVAPFSSCPQPSPASDFFPSELAVCIRRPKYWSFIISPSNEYIGLFPLGLTSLISLLSKRLTGSH